MQPPEGMVEGKDIPETLGYVRDERLVEQRMPGVPDICHCSLCWRVIVEGGSSVAGRSLSRKLRSWE